MPETLLTTPAATSKPDAGTSNPPSPQDAVKAVEPQAKPAETQPTAKDGDAGELLFGDKGKPAEKPAEKPEPGVPEKYEFAPIEGREFHAETLTEFSEVAKDLKMTQEAAQTMLERGAKILDADLARQVQKTRDEWAAAALADKEIGGDKLPEVLAVAKKALVQHGSPALIEWFDKSAFGNNVENIKAWYRIGKLLGEEKIITGGGAQTPETDPAKIMFPDMK